MTRVNARRYDWCVECDEQTVQWIIEAPMPKRNSWSPRKPARYICQVCGTENY